MIKGTVDTEAVEAVAEALDAALVGYQSWTHELSCELAARVMAIAALERVK